jgi:hypothetical protein
VARNHAVTTGTHSKHAQAFSCWIEFTHRYGFGHGTYMDGLGEAIRIHLLGALYESVKQGDYTKGWSPDKPLLGNTAKEHVDQVAQAFVDTNRPDPQLDRFGNNSRLLSRQHHGHTNLDPATTHEKALMPSVIIRMWELAETTKEKCLARLVIGAFFHATQSYKYLKVNGERRTHIIFIRDVRFFRHHVELSHDDPDLAFSDAVAITFHYQKTNVQNATITMYHSGLTLLCPIKAWAAVIQYVCSLPNTTNNSPVCTYFQPHPDATPVHPRQVLPAHQH